MPYVDRDANGNINGVYACEQREGQELLADDNADVFAFVNRAPNRSLANGAAIKNLSINRALKKGNLALAIKLQGGL